MSSNDKTSAASHPESWHSAQQRFEAGMAQVRAAVQAAPEEMARMEQAVRELYVDTDERTRLETTGEHTKAKLTDNPYRHAVDPKDVPPAPMPDTKHRVFYEPHVDSDEGLVSMPLPNLTDEQVDQLYEAVTHRAPKRGWTPTTGELAFAMGIVVFIIVLFLFIAFAYPGW